MASYTLFNSSSWAAHPLHSGFRLLCEDRSQVWQEESRVAEGPSILEPLGEGIQVFAAGARRHGARGGDAHGRPPRITT